MVTHIMKKNITCYMSEIGHKNFYYPTKTKVILKENAAIEQLPWISSSKKLQAVKVKNKFILYTTNIEKNIENSENFSVIWIEKTILPLSSAG